MVTNVQEALITYATAIGAAQHRKASKNRLVPASGNACSAVFTGVGIYFTIVGVLATIFIPYAVIPAAIAFGGLSGLAGFLGFAAC